MYIYIYIYIFIYIYIYIYIKRILLPKYIYIILISLSLSHTHISNAYRLGLPGVPNRKSAIRQSKTFVFVKQDEAEQIISFAAGYYG